jgi:O-antigen/teichoic acid export membrane protein
VQKKFITNLALLLLLNVLIKPFWLFGIDRTVQNSVSPEDFGVYFTLFNFSMLFNILLDVGITNFNNKNIAQHKQLLTKYLSGIVAFKFVLAAVYFLVTFVVGYLSGYDSERFYMLLFLAINQFLISFVQYLRSNIAGLQLFALDSLLSVLDKSLLIIFCSVLLFSNFFDTEFELIHFVYAQTLAYSITLIVVFGAVLLNSDQFKLKLNKPFSLMILKQTYPYAFLVLTMTFYYRLDAIMLDMMLEDGELQAAIYAQAYRLMDASNQIGVLFAALLLPMFANMIMKKQKIDDLVKLSFSLIFLPAIVAAIFCYSYANEIMGLMYKGNTDASEVLILLMFCFVAIASTYIFGTLLTANGSLRTLNKLAIGGMFLNLTLNYILIPIFKAEGSAIASLITQSLIVVAQIFIVKKVFNFRINYLFILSLFSYIILLGASIYYINIYVSGLYIQLGLFVVLSIILALVMKIINVKKMFQILVSKEL